MIVITGAAGFIGSVLAQYLARNGRNDLLLVDRFTKTTKWKNLLGIDFNDFIDRDIFIEHLNDKAFSKKIDLVLHMGACTDTTEFNLDYLLKQNYDYSKKLCSWCMDRSVRFIYASSAAVYGDGAKGFSDREELTHELIPLNPYGFSKWLFDEWVISRGYSKSIVGLRFFNVFGPNEYHKGKMSSVVYRSFPMAKKEGVVRLYKSYVKDTGHGEQKRDFIYVKDVIKVIDFFINSRDRNGIFNVGTGRARSFNDLGAAVLSALDKKERIEYFDMPEEIRDKYQYLTEADMSKLSDVGYTENFMSLEDAVSDYVKNYLLKDNPYY